MLLTVTEKEKLSKCETLTAGKLLIAAEGWKDGRFIYVEETL